MNILSLKNITYTSNNSNILKDISLDICKGDCISIIGPSGSGKSTLLKICADLLTVSSGDIYYNEKNFKSYNPIELRREISYCLQLPFLFGTNVYDNLKYPFEIRKEPVNIHRILELLDKFNLNKNYLYKDITSLSGGEKQRISIIRNILYIPHILLLDEATSALDSENAEIVENYIKELNNLGTTVLWITHNLNQSQIIFNKRITICDGKLKAKEVLI